MRLRTAKWRLKESESLFKDELFPPRDTCEEHSQLDLLRIIPICFRQALEPLKQFVWLRRATLGEMEIRWHFTSQVVALASDGISLFFRLSRQVLSVD